MTLLGFDQVAGSVPPRLAAILGVSPQHAGVTKGATD